jgi:hypothetical protein
MTNDYDGSGLIVIKSRSRFAIVVYMAYAHSDGIEIYYEMHGSGKKTNYH